MIGAATPSVDAAVGEEIGHVLTADSRRDKRQPVQHMSLPARAVVLLVLKPWAARAAIVERNRSRAEPTEGCFTRRDVHRLLDTAWANFDRLAPDLLPEPTPGSRQNVTLACLTLAMLQALTDDDITRDNAIELVGDTCSKIYARRGQIPRTVTRLLTREPAQRMRISVDAFLRYPFNRPGYRYQNAPKAPRQGARHAALSGRRLPRSPRSSRPGRRLVVQPRLSAGAHVGRHPRTSQLNRRRRSTLRLPIPRSPSATVATSKRPNLNLSPASHHAVVRRQARQQAS